MGGAVRRLVGQSAAESGGYRGHAQPAAEQGVVEHPQTALASGAEKMSGRHRGLFEAGLAIGDRLQSQGVEVALHVDAGGSERHVEQAEFSGEPVVALQAGPHQPVGCLAGKAPPAFGPLQNQLVAARRVVRVEAEDVGAPSGFGDHYSAERRGLQELPNDGVANGRGCVLGHGLQEQGSGDAQRQSERNRVVGGGFDDTQIGLGARHFSALAERDEGVQGAETQKVGEQLVGVRGVRVDCAEARVQEFLDGLLHSFPC